MNGLDIAILVLVAVGLFFAVRAMIRRRKRGGCAGCTGNCAVCRQTKEDR